MSLSPTGREFVPTIKTKLFLCLYKVFGTWSQWFITHCDTKPLDLEGFRNAFIKLQDVPTDVLVLNGKY